MKKRDYAAPRIKSVQIKVCRVIAASGAIGQTDDWVVVGAPQARW